GSSNGAAATGSAATGTATATAPAVTASKSSSPVKSEIDAIDLLDTAGSPVLKRLAPLAGGGLLLVLVILLIRRLRG
ncbi:MAG TPA: carbon monoxide dehydrogenase, partial [Pseudonocardia sp.]|nr:carbon monoxide dehydrogenase [Pseudonocardia sp.]